MGVRVLCATRSATGRRSRGCGTTQMFSGTVGHLVVFAASPNIAGRGLGLLPASAAEPMRGTDSHCAVHRPRCQDRPSVGPPLVRGGNTRVTPSSSSMTSPSAPWWRPGCSSLGPTLDLGSQLVLPSGLSPAFFKQVIGWCAVSDGIGRNDGPGCGAYRSLFSIYTSSVLFVGQRLVLRPREVSPKRTSLVRPAGARKATAAKPKGKPAGASGCRSARHQAPPGRGASIETR